MLSIQELPIPTVHLPIGGNCTPESIVKYSREFEPQVFYSTITSLCKIAEWLASERAAYESSDGRHSWDGVHGKTNGQSSSPDKQITPGTLNGVRLLLFSGEPFFEDQRALISRAFPGAIIRSLVYGSIDAGVIGFPTFDPDSRVHTVASPFVVVEILDSNDKPITENGVSGSVVATNLMRKLMPIVRYPVGDRACWTDYEKGEFRLLDRDGIGARIGPVTMDFTQMRQIVADALKGREIGGMQAVVDRWEIMDRLTLKIAYKPETEAALCESMILEQFEKERPMFQDHVQRKMIAPLKVKWVETSDLWVNPRSGKIANILDRRLEQ